MHHRGAHRDLGWCPACPKTEAPLGHSRVSHREIGWCGHCHGRDLAQEAAAWRILATLRDETPTPARAD
ncbi:hypothetical protein [Streptomyces chilikensis]|uniref:Uncharacterized protein n=1 Tax=Streptomyces chilikensis TaxID=1194079 RepID=A0ABV3EJC5_9ACTN